jgi:hypothetical protein
MVSPEVEGSDLHVQMRLQLRQVTGRLSRLCFMTFDIDSLESRFINNELGRILKEAAATIQGKKKK